MTSPSSNDIDGIDLPNLLNCYFSHLTQLNSVAATKVTKELKSVILGNFLIKFSNSEETYFSLEFLKPKRFRRENFLFHNYAALADELRNEINPFKPRVIPEEALSSSPTNYIRGSQLYIDLCQALINVISIRKELVNAYRIIYQNINSPLFPFEQWEHQLEICKSKLSSILPLVPLKSFIQSIELEVNVCLSLVQSYRAILDFDLKTSIFKLFSSHHIYYQWKKLCFPKPLNSSSTNTPCHTSPNQSPSSTVNSNYNTNFSSFFQALIDFNRPQSLQLNAPKVSNLMLWLEKLYDHIASKLTLYFQEGLSDFEKELGGETKSLWRFTTNSLDYYHQIFQFRKRSGAHSIALIYLVQPDKPFRRKGFAGQSLPYVPPSGLESFPCIFCHPEDPPTDHWPNLISIILSNQLNTPMLLPFHQALPGSPMENDSDLPSAPEPIPIIHFYDRKVGATYYLGNIDSRVVLSIIFLDRHNTKEPGVTEFISGLITKLNLTQLIPQLVKLD